MEKKVADYPCDVLGINERFLEFGLIYVFTNWSDNVSILIWAHFPSPLSSNILTVKKYTLFES